MSSTNKTPYFELPQFIGTDIPTWLGDFNDAMSDIDTALKTNADRADLASTQAGQAVNTANAANDAVSALQTAMTGLGDRVSACESTDTAQSTQISQNAGNISDLDGRVTALEQSGGAGAFPYKAVAHLIFGDIPATTTSPKSSDSISCDNLEALESQYDLDNSAVIGGRIEGSDGNGYFSVPINLINAQLNSLSGCFNNAMRFSFPIIRQSTAGNNATIKFVTMVIGSRISGASVRTITSVTSAILSAVNGALSITTNDDGIGTVPNQFRMRVVIDALLAPKNN